MGDFILGDYSYSYAERRGAGNTVTIGKFCSIAVNVRFDSGFAHNPNFISTFPFHQKIEGLSHLPSNILIKGDINIGNCCYLGEGAVIMSGITVGHGAIIGCEAVVTKDVAPYSIVGGVPAKLIRRRFSEDQIDSLLKIKWWDWSEEKIKENAHLIQSDNIEEFLKIHG